MASPETATCPFHRPILLVKCIVEFHCDMVQKMFCAEVNLIEKRARMRSEKRVTYKDETMPSTSSYDSKIDNLVKTMERMMGKISLNERMPPGESQPISKNINKTPNFKRDAPQMRQRDNDQQIRPPFQDNYLDEG